MMKNNLKDIKIDIVYTWVDDSDPVWNKKKDYYLNKEEKIVRSNNDKCRYKNNDELKYSLRSLEKNANWINNIYIVTDSQIPKWLNIENPRIKIVDHKDIIPEKYLPTFNSCAIEHCISNIKGLSEYFLYGCDDNFFARPITPNFFFKKDGYPVLRYSTTYEDNEDSLYKKMVKNSDNLVASKFRKKIKHFAHHNIDAYRKSDLISCKTLFNDKIEQTVASRFRKDSNIERTVYANYAVAIKHGHYKNVSFSIKSFPVYRYIPFARKIVRLLNEKFSYETVYISGNELDYIKFLQNPNTKLFCINDGENIEDKDKKRLQSFLEIYFPKKSSFEK